MRNIVERKILLATIFCVFNPAPFAFAAPFAAFRDISSDDNPQILNPRAPLERNLLRLNEQVQAKVLLNIKPWADGPWSIESGIIANRYADGRFGNEGSFSGRLDYVKYRSVVQILKQSEPRTRAALIDQLSPAEKYDLLVGDEQGTLTKAQWDEGALLKKEGKLRRWMGICEGSAAASTFYPEPQRHVDLQTSKGDTIRFHILDIKALASLLWSAYNSQLPVIGGRCHKKTSNKRNGIEENDACFSPNPASFHIALLNFLGLKGRPLFLSRTTSDVVWNVSVLGYNIQYFKVTNGRTANRLEEGLTSVADAHDKYQKYRSRTAQDVIGVKTSVKVAEGYNGSRDKTVKAKSYELSYEYDLELDRQGVIVGGEWRGKNHPDFLWSIEDGFEPRSVGDIALGPTARWDGEVVSSSWLNAVRQASQKNQPLKLIVDGLIRLSTKSVR